MVNVSRSSQVTQGGTIRLEVGSRITVEKVDADTGLPLAGAIFKVTKPDGTEILLAPTDINGLSQSPRFTEAELKSGNFTLTEVSAPQGYVTDTTPYTLTVTQAGVVQQVRNSKQDPSAAVARITATKVLTGRELKEGEFNFTLTSEDGSQVYRASNQADGKIHFDNLTFTQAGTYTYTLQEEAGYDLTVTYDTTPKTIQVEVKDNGAGQLVAEVISGPVTITNTTVPTIITPPGNPDDGGGSGSSSSSSSDRPQGGGGSSNGGPSHTANGGSNRVLPRTGEMISPAVLIGLVLFGSLGAGVVYKKIRS